MASLKNPAIAGDVQFETFIYGAPPLAYPASLSQYVIYNTPDPAYITGRIDVSAFATSGLAPRGHFSTRTYRSMDMFACPAGDAPSCSSCLRTAIIALWKIPHPDTCIYANCWRRMGSSRQRLT